MNTRSQDCDQKRRGGGQRRKRKGRTNAQRQEAYKRRKREAGESLVDGTHIERQQEYRKRQREAGVVDETNTRRQEEHRTRQREAGVVDETHAERDEKYKRQRKEKIEMIDFSTKKLPSVIENQTFSDFEQDVERAVMLWYLNSGSLRFDDVDNLSDEKLHKESLEHLREEIRNELLEPDELEDLIRKFYEAQGRGGYPGGINEFESSSSARPNSRDAFLTSCGTCGIRKIERNRCQYKEVSLQKLHMYRLTDEELIRCREEQQADPLILPINEDGDLEEFHLWKLRSLFVDEEDGGATYFVHPELVHMRETQEKATFLCDKCISSFNNEEVGRYSIASGIDFGNFFRLPLTRPNQMERAIISTVRHYYTIMKIQAKAGQPRSDYMRSSLRAHAIVFEHDAPYVAAEALLSAQRIKDIMQIQFIGPKGEMDKLIRDTLGASCILGRGYVVYQWLAVLSAINLTHDNQDRLDLPCYEDVKTLISKCNDYIVKTALQSTDEESLSAEARVGDDTANVRSTANKEDVTMSFENNDDKSNNGDDDPALQFSLLTSKQKTSASKSEATVTVLEAAADALDIDVSDELKEFESRREADPVSSLGYRARSDFALAAAFPDVFLFGKAYGREKGTLNSSQREHLLLQFTNVPASCRELIFYLFDQLQIMQNILGVHMKQKSDPRAFREFVEMILSREFKEDLKFSVKEPESKTAEKVLKKIMPVLTMSGSRTLFGAVERNVALAKLMGMGKWYGPACNFLTMAPDDVNNPTSLRASYRSCSNVNFPAVVSDDFFTALEKDSELLGEGDIAIPCAYSDRAKAACNNPVAVVVEYRTLIENVLSILIGRPPSHQSNGSKIVRSTYFALQGKGIYGYMLAAFGGHEVQKRGAFHTHLLLYGGLSPRLLEGVASYPELCKEVSNALDQMYTAQLPREVHTTHLLEKEMRKKRLLERHVPSALRLPPSQLSKEDWKKTTQQNILTLRHHRHTFTCYEPPKGAHGCRGCFPCGDSDGTKPVQLECQFDVTRDAVVACPKSSIDVRRDTNLRNLEVEPIPVPDERCIVWEVNRPELASLPTPPEDLAETGNEQTWYIDEFERAMSPLTTTGNKILQWLPGLDVSQIRQLYEFVSKELPGRNGWIVESSDVLTNVLGSNTAAYLLGNTSQSNSSVFYVAPYMCKNKASLEACLTVFIRAYEHVKKFPSVADDSGTSERTAKHIVTHVLNTLNIQMEVTDTQAAAALLNFGSEISSDSFAYYGPYEAMRYLDCEIATSRGLLSNNDDRERMSEDDSESDESMDDFIVEDDDNENEENLNETDITVMVQDVFDSLRGAISREPDKAIPTVADDADEINETNDEKEHTNNTSISLFVSDSSEDDDKEMDDDDDDSFIASDDDEPNHRKGRRLRIIRRRWQPRLRLMPLLLRRRCSTTHSDCWAAAACARAAGGKRTPPSATVGGCRRGCGAATGCGPSLPTS